MGANTAKRKRLFAESNKCFWCGTETVWEILREGVPLPKSATVDHVFGRRAQPRGRRQVVLACFTCNQERNDEENAIVAAREAECRQNVKKSQTSK